MYPAFYTEFILYVCLFAFSCIFEIVRNPRIKYIRSHDHLVPMFLCFQVFKFNFNPLLFLPWESQNLIWSRLSFQTFSKMQGTIPKRKKKCRQAFTLSSVFLAASITTVAELLRTLCAALVAAVLLREEIPFVVVFLC